MPFVLPLIWYIPYYLFFNLVFLIPMSLLIFIFQLILVFSLETIKLQLIFV